ncbi:MAG: hypothetical protein COV99_08180 [Bacteroidetes bacterium CG12_big_fil_rev_8_21_14_0_65_60_17]|nr:MAG: hypothetical protein COV99_08180 [Bacteroidetes bacterium CG12_big_fil_rev_8_21_14_0_65_60_17]
MVHPQRYKTVGLAAWALSLFSACVVALLGLSPSAWAQTPPPLPDAIPLAGNQVSLSQTVTVRVLEINRIAISGDVLIPIAEAEAGTPLSPVTHSGSTYALTVNGSDKKIVGSLDTEFPAGMELSVELTPPPGATATRRILSSDPVDLVKGVNLIAATNLGITYTGHADITVAPTGTAGISRRVTFTLTSN